MLNEHNRSEAIIPSVNSFFDCLIFLKIVFVNNQLLI